MPGILGGILEVHSVQAYINKTKGASNEIYGEILIDDNGPANLDLFKADKQHAQPISSTGCISLSGLSRSILGETCYMSVYLREKLLDLEVCAGHLTMEGSIRQIDNDRPVGALFSGEDGYAVFHLSFFKFAMQASVKIVLLIPKGEKQGYNIFGEVSAQYSSYRYVTEDSRKYDQTRLFDSPEEKAHLLSSVIRDDGVEYIEIPLIRHVVAAPIDDWLIIDTNLCYNESGKSQIVNENFLFFPTLDACGKVSVEEGVLGRIQVSVTWQTCPLQPSAHILGTHCCTPQIEETGQNADAESKRTFNYKELAEATKYFNSDPDVLLGSGRYGSVFRGELSVDKVISVKRLNPLDHLQSEDEFVAEVLLLSQLHHPNLVDLIGYSAEGDNRLLVFKYMPLGSLERYLHVPSDDQPLDWSKRIKILAGIARGIDYLNRGEPSIVIGNLKPSNILLDEGFNPKLSDFELSSVCKDVSNIDMGTSIYRAPEFASTGKVSSKSDVYSFGVILLEIISGRKAYDDIKHDPRKASLVKWWLKQPARERIGDRTSFLELADPKMKGEFSRLGLCKVLRLASMCLRKNVNSRPSMKLVVAAMDKVDY